MTNPITEARDWVAAALDPLEITVHTAPPEAVTPPCVIVGPSGGGWVEKTRVAGRVAVSLDLTVLVPQSTGRSALDRLEDLLWQVLGCDGISPKEEIRPPERRTWGAAECYGATVTVQVLANCEG